MNRGFTLLELLIVLSVFTILLIWAAPNYQMLSEATKMRRLASELNGIVLLGKSQAVLRRERLWAHIILSESVSDDGRWRIELTDSDIPETGNIIQKLDGQPFSGLVITTNYSSDQISFDDVHGRPSSGHIRFYPVGHESKALKLVSHTVSARIRVCSDHESTLNYGYSVCGG